MENKLILKNKELKEYDSRILGISGENEQEVLIFTYEDEFIDGTCYLELEFPNGDKGFIELEKHVDNECYKLEVKNSLLKNEGLIKMQLKIVQDTAVWKSKGFEMYVLEAINATESIEEDYPDFVSTTIAQLEELEKNKQDKLTPGENITIENGVISAIGGITKETDPTVPSWAKEPNKPSYTAEEVGALPDSTELFSGDYNDLSNKPTIPDVSGFITNTVDNLINYYQKSETYTQEEVKQLISQIPKFSIQPVDELPTENISNTTVYLFKTSETETGNLYTEYIYVNNNWEELGTQRLDLTGYATEDWVNNAISNFLTETQVETLINNALINYTKTTDLANVATSGSYNDLNDKPEIPSIEGLASETYVDEKVASIDIPDEVVIGTEEPTTTDWKIWIDEDEEAPEYVEKDNVETEVIAESMNPVSGGAVKTYVDTQIGNIETLLAEV